MSALVLLSDYKMKKNSRAKKESEAPVTLGFMREFRAEMLSQFASIDLRFRAMETHFNGRLTELGQRIDKLDTDLNAKIDKVNVDVSHRIDSVETNLSQCIDLLDTKMDMTITEIKTMNHQTKLIIEEQNLRNKQAYDGYALTYEALQDLKSRIKPECLES